MPFTYAIADLHGRYDPLSEAVTKIASAFEARNSQAGRLPAPSGLKPSPVQNSGLTRSHCSSLTAGRATTAPTNKCLAQSNKSGTGSKAAKKRRSLPAVKLIELIEGDRRRERAVGQ